ncbi:MAG: hypothetical protein WKF85_12575 [Chitinophagaceae bacterium]
MEISIRDKSSEGDKQGCEHPSIKKEYYLGMHIDYICSVCGEPFTKGEKDKIIEKRKDRQGKKRDV